MARRETLSVVFGAILCAAGVAAAYWPALNNDFVWDDWVPLVDSPLFRDPRQWWEALLAPPLGNLRVAFRPIAMLSFMLQLWAGQTEPAAFHLTNVAVHAANVFLLVLIAWRLLPRTASALPAAIVCGLVYGLHPALTEPVVWISCRYDLLMTFFLLLALLFDRVLPERGWARTTLVGAAFLGAALCKETAVGFVFALPIVHLALDQARGSPLDRGAPGRIIRENGTVYAALFIACVVYLAVRYAASGASLGMERMAMQFDDLQSPAQRLLAVLSSMAYYICDALWPFQGITPSRSLRLPIAAIDVLPVIGASAAVIAAVGIASRTGAAGRALALLFVAFLVSLAPVSNFAPLPGRLGELWAASRYLAFPLTLLCLALPFAFQATAARVARHLSRPRALLAALVGAWLAASLVSVRGIIPLWANDGTVNYWAIQQGAADYWRYYNLGNYYVKIGATQKARETFLAALKLRNWPYGWYGLGIAEAGLGNTRQAINRFRRSLDIDRNLIRSRIHIARLEMSAGDYGAATQVLEEGLTGIRQADFPDEEGVVRYLLGTAYAALGRDSQAVAQLTAARALASSPQERAAAEAALKSVGTTDPAPSSGRP